MIYFHRYYRGQMRKQLRLAQIEIERDNAKYEAAERRRILSKPALPTKVATLITAAAIIGAGI